MNKFSFLKTNANSKASNVTEGACAASANAQPQQPQPPKAQTARESIGLPPDTRPLSAFGKMLPNGRASMGADFSKQMEDNNVSSQCSEGCQTDASAADENLCTPAMDLHSAKQVPCENDFQSREFCGGNDAPQQAHAQTASQPAKASSIPAFLLGKKGENNAPVQGTKAANSAPTFGKVQQTTGANPVAQKPQTAAQSVAPKPGHNPLSGLLRPKPAQANNAINNALRGTGFTVRLAQSAQKQQDKTFAGFGNKAPQKVNTLPNGILVAPEKVIEAADKKVVQTIALKSKTPTLDLPVLPTVDHVEKKIEWDESQLVAIEGALRNKFCCVIGAAGTGKTTVQQEIVRRLEDEYRVIDLRHAKHEFKPGMEDGGEPEWGLPFSFCAFTGRAVQQMKNKLPRKYWPNANTIHATLAYMPEYYEDFDPETGSLKNKIRFAPQFGAWRKLPYKVYLIDEGGMLGCQLWNKLQAAMLDDARVIVFGDINQLPPVQDRSMLGFAMTQWPTFELTTIHRTAQDSPIIVNAHRVLKGNFPTKDEKRFSMVALDSGQATAANQVIGSIKKLHSLKVFDEMRDALIVPTNKGDLGQVELNSRLTPYFNPEQKVDGVVVNKRTMIKTGVGNGFYAVGDKLMLLANDNNRGLTNGMCGRVVNITVNDAYKMKGSDTHIDFSDFEFDLTADSFAAEKQEEKKEEEKSETQRQASHIMTVEFDLPGNEKQEVIFKTAGEYRKVAHAYAFTCHKSQGGEYHTVVIALHSANRASLCREWLYTAITRAQQRVVLLYNDRGLLQALQQQRVKGRNLQEKIDSFAKLAIETAQSDTEMPVLPANEIIEI